MKLTQNTSPVETGQAISAPTTFKIAASKEAFKILSSGLYNNKIRAIIRELSCNAYDAHVAAGKKDVPFEIHLPTSFEPFFSVKDNGVGLSHDEVINLYTTYFGTNKSESNDYVGALGLGSKSPFCYTEGFTVTSRFQGKTRVYSCFIDQNGMPAVQLQEELDTPDIPNGLEVMFPVHQDDIWEFENQASVALEFFEPRPEINSDITINKQEYVVRTPYWGLRKEPRTKHGSGLRAIQGLVQYAVGTIDKSRLSDDQSEVIDLPLDLFFPIGELAVAASREILSNDEHTIGNILKALGNVRGTLLESCKEELKKCTTLWEARLKVFSMINTPGIGRLVNSALNKGELDDIYTNFKLSKDRPTINQLDYKYVDLYVLASYYRTESKLKLGRDLSKYDLAKIKDKNPIFDISFNVEQGAVFIINDVGFGVEKYAKAYIENTTYKTGYFITRRNKDITTTEVQYDAKRILEALGNPPSVLVSTLKEKYKTLPTKTAYQAPARKLLWFNTDRRVNRQREGYTVSGWMNGWEDGTNHVVGTAPMYYVPVKRLVPQTGNFRDAQAFKEFIIAVKNCGLFGLTETSVVYGLPPDSPYLKSKNWVELTGHVFSQLKTIMTPAKELSLSIHLKQFETSIEEAIKYIAKHKPLSENSFIQKFAIQLITAREGNKVELSNLAVVVNKAEKEGVYKLGQLIDFKKMWEEEVMPEYPLIPYLRNLYYEGAEVIKEYVQYFKLVDEDKERRALVLKEALAEIETSVTDESVYSNNQEENDYVSSK